MASVRNPARKLLVEGADDKRLIPHLMEANGVRWGDSKDDWVVAIESHQGVSDLLGPGTIGSELKSPGLEALGILIDADDDPRGRWNQIRARCISQFPSLPDEMPSGGLIDQTSKPHFGVWMMPDNESRGMLETFLLCLLPGGSDSMHAHAIRSRDEAKLLGAPFSEAHKDKALIHTWLAWQDPPGQQLHGAIIQRILNPTSERAGPFVSWFRALFNL